MILGTISAVDSDNGLQLIIDGEDTPTTKKYTYMASYVPAANDRVLIEEISGSYVIMGKIISDVASSGIARTADTATSAATSAECTGNAATATKADEATALTGASTQQVQVISWVNNQYSSQLGGYYVASIQTQNVTVVTK